MKKLSALLFIALISATLFNSCVYDVPAGEHSFYAVIQNWEEFDGGLGWQWCTAV